MALSSLLVAEHLIAQHSAIKMLHSRVKIILEYVKAVEAGERSGGLSSEAKHVEKNLTTAVFKCDVSFKPLSEASQTRVHNYKPLSDMVLTAS